MELVKCLRRKNLTSWMRIPTIRWWIPLYVFGSIGIASRRMSSYVNYYHIAEYAVEYRLPKQVFPPPRSFSHQLFQTIKK